ncbi:MAG: hypothetical protein IBX44_01230 [Sulfurospirillum sp.]|nr:hypothetical protein [Sulfurospirillum sp.]
MKTFIYFLIVAFSLHVSLFAAEKIQFDVSKYDMLFSKISDKRVGIEENQIRKVGNPFVMVVQSINEDGGSSTVIVPEIIYNLYAIVDKKAKINDAWYKLGDAIHEFKIKKIRTSSVLLAGTSGDKELFIRKNDANNFKFSAK